MKQWLDVFVFGWVVLIVGVVLLAANGPARELPCPDGSDAPDATTAPAPPRKAPPLPNEDIETMAAFR